MWNYTYYPSTPRINLPRPDPTISSSRLSPASSPHQYIVHKWGCMPTLLLRLPAVSECTNVWGVSLMLLLPPPPGDIPTSGLPHILLSSPWSVWATDGETPLGPSTSPISPPNFHWHTISRTVPLPYTASHGPAPFLPYFSTPSKLSPTIYALSSGSETPLVNRYWYNIFSSQSRGSYTTVVGDWHWYGTRPYLPQISNVGSHGRSAAPIPVCSFLMHSDGCSAYPRLLGFRSACTWGGSSGAPLGSWCCTPSFVW